MICLDNDGCLCYHMLSDVFMLEEESVSDACGLCGLEKSTYICSVMVICISIIHCLHAHPMFCNGKAWCEIVLHNPVVPMVLDYSQIWHDDRHKQKHLVPNSIVAGNLMWVLLGKLVHFTDELDTVGDASHHSFKVSFIHLDDLFCCIIAVNILTQ